MCSSIVMLIDHLSSANAGDAPIVVANGGFSGLFPDSSQYAYLFTYLTSFPDTVSLCNVELTRDGVGICLPTMLLNNCTDITDITANGPTTYSVNGVPTTGYFTVDYDYGNLSAVLGKL